MLLAESEQPFQLQLIVRNLVLSDADRRVIFFQLP